LCAILESVESGNLSIGQRSMLLACKETQVMECFKQVTGATISSYRHRLRMGLAMRRLCESDDSITQVAFDAGYEFPSNFAAAFKRTFGFSQG
jgi:AraC-like DNA-binding protein